MRGEKVYKACLKAQMAGSPPHARGKVALRAHVHAVLGITPACAGKSIQKPLSITDGGDHPRMRGEKTAIPCDRQPGEGSPPHARGKGLNTSIICCILAQNTYLHRNFV